MRSIYSSILVIAILFASCKQKDSSSKTDSDKKDTEQKSTSTGTGSTTDNTTTTSTTASGGWTAEEKRTFVETCTNSAAALGDKAKSYCECSLEKVQKLYPNPADVSGLTDAQTETIANECLLK